MDKFLKFNALGQRGEKASTSCIVNPFSPASSKGSTPTDLNKSFRSMQNNSSLRYDFSAYRERKSKQNFRLKKEFVHLGNLGTGTFGDVVKVRNRYDGLIYAIKKTRNPLKGSRQE